MTGKTFDEKFLENWDSDKQSFKDDFECLFETIKAFNEFMKTESLDIEAVENISEVYKEIDKVVREVEKYFINWTNKVIDEAKNKEDEFYYLKICRGLNQLNADIKFGEYEFWNGHNGKEELFSTTVDVLEELDVKFAVLKSQMQDSITKLERCKSWLEIRNPDFTTLTRKDDPLPVPDLTNPDLTAPTPKDDPSPTPDEIEPQDAPNEATSELYAGLAWRANKGYKADLSEVIKGLHHSERILKDGRKIELQELQAVFESLFNIEIGDIDTTYNSRMNTFKVKEDRKSFLDQMRNLNFEISQNESEE